MRPIILASKSPRRQQLLYDCGFDFEVRSQDTDESFADTMPVADVAPYLAQKKARASLQLLTTDDQIMITADSVVILDNEIFNKPADFAAAFAMLRRLAGSMHRVVTGVCLTSRDKEVVFSDITSVWLSPMTDAEIKFYINEYEPFDKAGSYGIQDWIGLTHIARIDGSYSNVMGLPTARLYNELLAF